MSNFAIIRLGKDSIADIRKIDALHESPTTPLSFTVHCKQVPNELRAGDYVFICFGSDNSQGAPTEWVRGVRALGTVVSKSGGPGYNDPWEVSVEIKVVLPQSVVRRDLLAHAPTAYYWCSGIPTIGIEANSQQTVQMIKEGEPDQNVAALAYSLSAHSPVFKSDTIRNYPALESIFDYNPPQPLAPAVPIAGATGATGAQGNALPELIERFHADAQASLLHVEWEIARRFASCLLSKRFMITTGLAGSGKTKLAQAFGQWLSTSDGFYKVVPVGADWTGNENVLGYPNGLDSAVYSSKPALDLILHARDNSDLPHFLILDEMNLSHVERYFADILSVIESEAKIRLYDGADRHAGDMPVPGSIELPKNLFIIGTVNVDETTYMFSPKVLDRANVIEFRMDPAELAVFLENPAKPDLSNLNGKGEPFRKAFVDAAQSQVTVPTNVKAAYDAEMLLLFKTLQEHGAEFGYRTAYEAARFIHFYKLLGNHADGDASWFPGAFDCVVFQKLLPKLHGSRAKLGPVLKKLWFLCVTAPAERGEDALKAAGESKSEPTKDIPAGAPYRLSAEKIYRMWRLMMDNGFTSFAEA